MGEHFLPHNFLGVSSKTEAKEEMSQDRKFYYDYNQFYFLT